MSATLVGVGLARFAFAPVEAALVENFWFPASEAAYLAAANLSGYLLGALLARVLARRFPAVTILRAMMLVVAASFLACASDSMPFAWFFVWRLVSGFAGAVLIVLAAPTVLAHIRPARRGFVTQMSMYGLAIGILMAGTAAPLLIDRGVTEAWLGFGVLSLVITVATWRLWPPPIEAPATTTTPTTTAGKAPRSARRMWLQYSLVSLGVVPHMVFLVDFLARDLTMGVGLGARFYAVYALGALVGPFFLAYIAHAWGIRGALRVGMPIQLVAVALLLVSDAYAVIAVSCFLAGVCMPGIVSAFLARSQELAQGDPVVHRAIWSTATAIFAASQAFAGYGTAFMIGHGDFAYPVLLGVSTAAMAVAIVIDYLPLEAHMPRQSKRLAPG